MKRKEDHVRTLFPGKGHLSLPILDDGEGFPQQGWKKTGFYEKPTQMGLCSIVYFFRFSFLNAHKY